MMDEDARVEVSFLLPTCRKFEQYASLTIDSIFRANLNFDYEIIVCSKEKVDYECVTWVEEPKDNRGGVLPFNLAYQQAKGRYVSILVDDFTINYTFPKIIEFLNSEAFEGQKVKFSALAPQHHKISNSDGILRFPVFERESALQHLGSNIFDSRFKHHNPDVYLTRYLKEKLKVNCPICPDAHIFMREEITDDSMNGEDAGALARATSDMNEAQYL